MKTKHKYILSIDPSINYCGVAVHRRNGDLLVYTLLRPSSKCSSHLDKSRSIYNQVRVLLDAYPKTQLIIECPQYWGAAGYLARESGALFKLTFVCGMLFSLADDVIVVTPNDWKGQLPKAVVNNRLRKIYPDVDIAKLDHNIVDAIGIGNFYLTEYGKDKV